MRNKFMCIACIVLWVWSIVETGLWDTNPEWIMFAAVWANIPDEKK